VVAEVMRWTIRLRDMVTGNAPVSVLREHVTASGVESLGVQAARMVLAGTTTAEEISVWSVGINSAKAHDVYLGSAQSPCVLARRDCFRKK